MSYYRGREPKSCQGDTNFGNEFLCITAKVLHISRRYLTFRWNIGGEKDMNFYVNAGYLKDCIVLSLALASGMSREMLQSVRSNEWTWQLGILERITNHGAKFNWLQNEQRRRKEELRKFTLKIPGLKIITLCNLSWLLNSTSQFCRIIVRLLVSLPGDIPQRTKAAPN